ncbi:MULTISPECIES: GlxA family transcriptional regulator [unclassified Streptomyces]|uniref:GlxA family transcriptional regulator n=1 Tax=unclassified Streptomyces TaxID=2593676 RepID=UPI00074AA4F3|nr:MULTISPECIES: GlxA family transcriptional regulator [unclassified Streptomyces]KUL69226.1 AraC family transcriptional regulator [Streptomyces sp. NRRL WC-3604]KUL69350.1 AraC family transcriptional regulator [Streptomyces sp. NRRL WC-3605]
MAHTGMAHTRDIAFVIFDGVKMLDVAGPAEVFAEANQFGAAYAIHYVSPSGKPVLASTGMQVPVDGQAADVPDPDTVVVAGGDILVDRAIETDLADTVKDLHARSRRTASVCTGSFILAAAGLLAGRRATTHWRHAGLLARAFPDVRVESDALFVQDAALYTSAGVSAGMDLALALVEEDHGADLTREVARQLVMFMQRPGGQSQFSAPLDRRPPRTSPLRAVVDLISAQPALDHSAAALAARVGVSPRQLGRLFAAELHTTPARYVELVRLDHAKALLDRGHTVAQTARGAGFGSAETMRRSFVARLGVSPSQYRDRFATTEQGKDTPR